MRKFIRLLLPVLFFVLPLALFAQEDFSADIVSHRQGDQERVPAKIYVTKNKMRVESAGRNGQSAAILMDFANQTTDMLMPAQNMYMEFPAGKGPGAQRFTAFFRPTDIENACGEWQKLATHQGGECHKVGNETVNGRNTVKYEATSANGDHSTVWLDPKIAFPVKWEGKTGGGELQNIKEGSLSSSLFEVPAGYRKMEMPAGMNMPNMQPH
ncbi:MAG: hypothetical protein WBM11_00685 [Terriglobales bacterium]